MFGFLKLQSCALNPEERLIYQSHFCSVCHAMTDFGGRLSSLLTNYDITFWLLLASALEQRPPTQLEQRPCTALPFRKVAVRPLSPELARTMAALNLVLVESKASDDRQDGERLKAGLARALYGRRFQKAHLHLSEIGFPLETLLALPAAQAKVEKAQDPTLSSLTSPTAETLAEVFAAIASHHKLPELAPALRSFGSNLGTYLYLWDAVEDLTKDTKKGHFNAINAACGGYLKSAGELMSASLDELQKILDGWALGPEGRLCRQLLATLRQRCQAKLQSEPTSSLKGPRRRLAQAGFVHKSDCEVGCCDCGCCDCNLCNCDPCGTDHNQCCEFNCCDLSECCCCVCSDTRRSSSPCCPCDCCGSGSSGGCCDNNNSHTDHIVVHGSTHDNVRKNPPKRGLFRQLGKKMGFMMPGDSNRRCPSCNLSMVELSVGSTDLEECRNCGGVWLDDKEIDTLVKLAELPHNLLNRYPTEERSKVYPRGERPCPVCEGGPTLVNVPYLDVPVEMCRTCHGFWLEHGVLRRVIQAKRSPDRLSKAHQQEWRCPYCETVAKGGSDTCSGCGAPRPKSGFTGKLA